MELIDLYNELKFHGIDDEKFYIMGLYGSKDDNEKISLLIKKDNNRIIYEIYYKEKEEKNILKTFDTKKDAFRYFKDILLSNDK